MTGGVPAVDVVESSGGGGGKFVNPYFFCSFSL